MANKSKSILKRLLYALIFLFLLLNIVAINQAYHLTHFYEHGTVNPVRQQMQGSLAPIKIALFGLKQEKLVGVKPPAAWLCPDEYYR